MKLFFESATQKLARKRSERIDEELRRNCSTTPPPINNVHNSLTSPAITSTHNNSSQITIENSNYCTRTTSSSSSGTPSGAGGPKILLLGAGDSGKTTVLKQLKILHGNGFSDLERMQYRGWIMDNIVDSMRALLHAMDRLGIPYGEQGNEFYGRQVKENFARISVPSSTSSSTIIGGGKISATGSTSMSGVGSDIPSHIHTAIKTLWADAGVRMCMRRSNEFFIQDTAEYFLNQLDRFFHISFIPTDQDILRARFRTTQVTETRFNIDNLIYRIFDVGGQRSDRLFWAPYFEGNIHAILFVISLAAYDQMLEEDVRCNRMEDAVQLFSSICSNSLLRDCNIILFLNKTDLFERKLKDSPVQKYFADYVPDSSCSTSELRTACRYFKRLFISQNVSHHPHGNSNYNNHEPQRRIYPHFTTGTDTAHMRVIISAVRDIVVRCALQASAISIETHVSSDRKKREFPLETVAHLIQAAKLLIPSKLANVDLDELVLYSNVELEPDVLLNTLPADHGKTARSALFLSRIDNSKDNDNTATTDNNDDDDDDSADNDKARGLADKGYRQSFPAPVLIRKAL